MSTGVCTVYGIERKLGSQNAPGSGTTDSGPSKQHSASGGHDQQQDRTELVIGHHKLRAWKDVDSSLPSARRACTYPETPTARSTSSQVLNDVQEVSVGSPQETTSLTLNDLPTDAIATILRKTLHPKYPGAIWGKNLHPAVNEARWFLMDGRNQSHRVLDKFPQDACVAAAQTCHIMRATLVCKRWKRIIYGEEGPGVVEHVAVTGSRTATKLPKTVRTLFIHGQNTDPMWRLVSKGGLSLLEAVLTMRSRRSKDFTQRLSSCCPLLKHVGITSPATGNEALRIKDLAHMSRLPELSALELVDCEVPATLEPLGAATSLRRLTLRCCGGVTGEHLTALAPLHSLQLFVVEDIDIGVDGFMAISALPDLRSLTLTSCDGIDRAGLELLCALSNLQYLDMSDVWEFAGDTLQPLASLTKLQVLALTDCENLQSSHLSVLRWLPQLKSLDLSRCARVDAYAMRHITHLTRMSALSLQGCEAIDSRAMKYLKDIPTLKRLNLTACRGVQTAAMRHLRSLTNLEVLSIADLVRVGNGALKYFCSLTNLRTLYVAGCPHITEEGLKLLRHHPALVYT